MSAAIRTIYLDIENQRQVDSDGNPVNSNEQMTVFAVAQKIIVRATLYLTGTTLFQAAAGAAWYFAIDDTAGDSVADPVSTVDADFNQVADWLTVDPTAGKICWPINTATEELATKLGTDAEKTLYGELWMNDPTDGIAPLVRWPITVLNPYAYYGSTTPVALSLGATLVKADGDDTVIYMPDGTTVAERYSPA